MRRMFPVWVSVPRKIPCAQVAGIACSSFFGIICNTKPVKRGAIGSWLGISFTTWQCTTKGNTIALFMLWFQETKRNIHCFLLQSFLSLWFLEMMVLSMSSSRRSSHLLSPHVNINVLSSFVFSTKLIYCDPNYVEAMCKSFVLQCVSFLISCLASTYCGHDNSWVCLHDIMVKIIQLLFLFLFLQ